MPRPSIWTIDTSDCGCAVAFNLCQFTLEGTMVVWSGHKSFANPAQCYIQPTQPPFTLQNPPSALSHTSQNDFIFTLPLQLCIMSSTTSSFDIPSSSTSSNSHLTKHSRAPSTQVLIAGTPLFQQTLGSILEAVRTLEGHIKTSSSSALLVESEAFDILITSLISQIGEVSDDLVDSTEEEGSYETCRANLRYSLQSLLDMVRHRCMSGASICLAFVVDALWKFMEASVDVVKGWESRNPSPQPPSPAPPPLAPILVSNLSQAAGSLCSPVFEEDVPKPARRRKSILKHIKSISNLGLRRKSHSEKRCSAMTPLLAQEMKESLRASILHDPRPAQHIEPDENHQ